MLRPKLVNIVLYFFIKGFIFYLVLMLLNNDFSRMSSQDIKNKEVFSSLFQFFLLMPLVCSLFLAAPLYYLFKIKNALLFTLLLLIFFIIEFIVTSYVASMFHISNNVYSIVFGVFIILILFYKSIFSLFQSTRS